MAEPAPIDRPDSTDHPAGAEPSAGWYAIAQAAVRAAASLVKSDARPTDPAIPTSPTIVSPDTRREQRLPPRQVRAKKWPVLHVGPTPQVDLATWQFRITGLVDAPRAWTWPEFRALPEVTVAADMHCVTRWSRLDNTWAGVRVRDVMQHVALKPEARFVLVHAAGGYSTNLPLDEFRDDDCLFAWANEGRPLSVEHGAPLRLVVPKLYAWKSAKWVCGVEFLAEDRPGFWERNGYHNHGDPWQQERYS